MRYDYIVAGGGTAGLVVAARLSEQRDLRVLLLEAGPDYPHDVPGELLDGSAAVTSGHNWDLQAFAGDGEEAAPPLTERQGRIARVFQLAAGRMPPVGARFPYPMGKVMGGGSAINAGLAFHARPEDYALWAAAGNGDWSWERVRPEIERLAGDLPIETAPPEALTRLQESFLAACLAAGHPRVDLRQGTAGGVGAIPKSFRQGRRVSTASLYLEAARQRANLTIQPGCLVDRIVFEGSRGELTASGVEARIDGSPRRFAAGGIVLAAGAIHSPAILLRSGVGAADEVARAGIEPRLDLPGVGKNLADHPAVSLWAVPRQGACRAGEPVHQVMLQQRSSPSAPLCDLQLLMVSALPTEKLPPLREVSGANVAMGITVVLATPRSRGRVELAGGDPTCPPRIFLNLLRQPDDLRRMMAGVRSAWSLLAGERIGAEVDRVVLWSGGAVESDPPLEKLIRATVRGAWHPAGTLRMGGEEDAAAVVDQHGRLRGCRNVTVADGSIMPALPSVPTNLTCMLVAERIARHLLKGLEG